MGWAGNRVSPQITATPRFPVGSRVLLKPADPKGRKKGMMVDCDGVVISVQETTTKYALRKLWRGVPVQRAYVYCVKTAGGVYATAAETASFCPWWCSCCCYCRYCTVWCCCC